MCPLLNTYISDVSAAITHFQSYKSVIPVRGAIILNKKMTKALMVKGWKSNATWGFPRGKINKNEPDDLCAIREVYEEIGFDISPYLNPKDFIEVTIRQKNFKLYVVSGVPGNTQFCPQTRKEISKIEWHSVKSLPAFSSDSTVQNNTNYFMVAPFMHGLSKYISKKRGLPSSLSKSEEKALKNFLKSGPESATNATSTEQEKDAAAMELLNLLKSSSQTQASGTSLAQNSQAAQATNSQSDRNILLDLLHGKNNTNQQTSEVHDMESAREILSLLQTNIERSKEVGELNDVSHQPPQLPPFAMGPNGLPNMMPQIPPWAYMNPMGPQMYPAMPPNFPPVNPGGMLPQFPPPYNGAVPPFPMAGFPPPPGVMPPGFPAQQPPAPVSGVPRTPNQNNANAANSAHPPVFDVPRSPTQTPQPNSTLLALLNSRSKGKKAPAAKPKPVTSPKVGTATSSSNALLSLLHQPAPAAQERAAEKPTERSSSNDLLSLLRPPVTSSPVPSPQRPSQPQAPVQIQKQTISQSQLQTQNQTNFESQATSGVASNAAASADLMQMLKKPSEKPENSKNDLLRLLKSPPPQETEPIPPSPAPLSAAASSSALLMGLLKGENVSSNETVSHSYNDIDSGLQDSAILNSSSGHLGDVSQAETSINIPDESSILLGMIKSQPSSTPELFSSKSPQPSFKPGISLKELEAQNGRSDSQSPGKELLQQLEHEERRASGSQKNNLLSLLNSSQSLPAPATESSLQNFFEANSRPNSRPVTQPYQSPSISSIGGNYGSPNPQPQTPPIGKHSTTHSPVAANNETGLQSSGNSLLSLLRPSGGTPPAAPKTVQSGNSSNVSSKVTSPLLGQASEQSHLDNLFSKLQVSNQSPAETPAQFPTPFAETVAKSTTPTPDAENQDLRTDLLAFLHNFSNGTLPGSK